MSSWKSYKLGDIAEITSSKRIFYSEYVPSGIPFWRSKEVIEKFNRKNISTDLFISNEKYQEIKSKFGVPQQNDILLTSVGTLGIPYLVQSDEQFYFKDGNLTWIKNINNELLNPLFLFKWLASSIGRESLSEITIGSTQEALTISGLKTLELLLPPLEEQKAIAEVLSSLDDKIDLLHRQNQTLESLAQTLFRQWFGSETLVSPLDEAKASFPNRENWEEKPLS
jgi:type I restriction enzyme S subunit